MSGYVSKILFNIVQVFGCYWKVSMGSYFYNQIAIY